MRNTLKFKSKEARDQSAASLRRDGRQNIRKRSVRNQSISPDYLADSTPDEGSPNGYGGRGTSFYAALYIVEWD